ncbi:hypothetical protein DEE91_01135 [Ralstonia pickettii]|jgi:hypothetical protein|uniref:DUF4376 domain-containing protein n=1 Tax=Ralstonia sp. RRA TaxID=3122075 RepID=UPI000664A02C|nr:hypothetical protein [Ralstonia insidiosa]MBX3770342.1 hypothetical protein [Ralstonia pickettii]NOZ14866.1 hypothetical protein [Betaproteobacteria bacterium]MBA9868314.1 hypothetical protein [Ralstonia insidiosa]MBA9911447.1 hypothetical protein [Ralstonia insidiosa]
MKTFIDTATQQIYAFENDVVVTSMGGVYSFKAQDGTTLNVPVTLQPHSSSAPASVQPLAAARAAQINKINAACAAALVSGFPSSALGTVRNYPSQDTDQRNLQSAVSAAVGAATTWATPIWCANSDVWSLAPHSAAQVQQVNTDWLAFRVAAQQKYADLVSQINAATSVSDVLTITWG